MNCGEIREWVLPLADTLAWPLVVLVLVWVFRPYIGKIIGRIHTIQYKDLQLRLSQNLEEAVSRAEALEPTGVSTTDVVVPTPSDADPRIIILNSWAAVEAAILRLATENQGTIGRTDRMSTWRRIQALSQAELLDRPLVASLDDLRTIRNLIAHGGDLPFDQDALQDFTRAAVRVESMIERLIGSS